MRGKSIEYFFSFVLFYENPDLKVVDMIPEPRVLIKVSKKSKRFFQVDVSYKKWTNEFYFFTMKPQVDLFSFVFLGEIEDIKKTFRN